jgi:microcystin-dependent protein
MSDQFVAEIRIFACNFAPTGWALCNGQLMPISQNTALFSLLGTTYGGDGKSTFALPDMQGNAPMQQGQGPGLSLYDLGQTGGEQAVTLLTTELPAHTHSIMGAGNPPPANAGVPDPTVALARSSGTTVYQATPFTNVNAMSPFTIGLTGSSSPHNNMMPYLTLNFCIALQGIFPSRP